MKIPGKYKLRAIKELHGFAHSLTKIGNLRAHQVENSYCSIKLGCQYTP